MHLTNAFKAGWFLLFVLSLCHAEIAWSLARVESRAHGAQANTLEDESTRLDTLQRMEFLQREIQELRGKVEEQGYQLQQLQEHQKKLYSDLDKRLREGTAVKSTVTTSALPPEGEAPESQESNQFVNYQADVTPSSTQELPIDDKEAYLSAYRLVQSKDYEGAINAFKVMMQQSPKGKYAPNAQYWLGEIYLIKGNLEQAKEAFDKVYHQYARHPKAADALLKLGYVEYAKGQWKQAGELLNQVKNQFPGTTAAQLADSRLQKMQQENRL